MQKLHNKVQLITYADSLGNNLKELKFVLDKYLKKAVFGVHLLPFYPSNGDRGFSVLTHKRVDSRFGNWGDVSMIAKKHEVMSDLVLNHIASKSTYFKDYLKNGDASKYADYFITAEKFSKRLESQTGKIVENIINIVRKKDFIFHDQGVNKISLKKIYRPRPGSPFIEFKLESGKIKNIWCTFSKRQIDLDVKNKDVKKLFEDILDLFSQNGIKVVRLDAIGYVIKDRGTKSFMIPKTYKFIEWICKVGHEKGLLCLPEVHYHYKHQAKLAKTSGVDYIYDFALPLITLYTLYTGATKNLKNWINVRPKNQITTLDTHDGLPIIDAKGLMTKEEIKFTSSLINLHGGNAALRASGNNSKNVDVYQVNCTYYSALGENDDAYIAARVIQFFIPGIPQVYYVGLLAGKNDIVKLNRTGIGRNINRHNYSLEEIEKDLSKKVVRRLIELMEFRNFYPAFDGKFTLLDSEDDCILILKWKDNKYYCKAHINTKTYVSKITYLEIDTNQEKSFIV
jgi:sucrose phosphorylase